MHETRVTGDPHDFPRDGSLKPDETALLIIDMQADFLDPDAYLAQQGYETGGLRAVVRPLTQALAAARRGGLQVIHTRQGYRRDLADVPKPRPGNTAHVSDARPTGSILRRGEPGWEIIPELAPVDGEAVIDKTANSAFYGTDLDLVLRAKRIENLIFTGVTIDVCVHTTLRDAVDRGFDCLLLADCCGAVTPELHKAACDMVKVENGVFGAVADAAAFCAAMDRF